MKDCLVACIGVNGRLLGWHGASSWVFLLRQLVILKVSYALKLGETARWGDMDKGAE